MTGFESFVGINPWTALFTFCNMLITFSVLKHFLFEPVKKMIDDRQNEIDTMYADADAAKQKAAALETEGVSAMLNAAGGDLKPARKMAAKGVVIEPEEDGLSITLYVMIRFGFAMAEVAGKVQKAVLAALHDMTGFNIHAVNVMIGGICFD